MIIKNIEIENYTCYYGINTFDFTEGINVIIGDNGYGKSQLFDAIFWVINDQIYMSKECKNFRDIKKSSIVSDKAIHDAAEGIINTSVSLTISDNNSRSSNIYIVKRNYQIEIKDGIIHESPSSVLKIMKKELGILTAKEVTDSMEIKSILSRILPPNKKEYLWFQGERVDSIIDFKQQDTLIKAINVLSNITVYDKLKGISSSLAYSARKEFTREQKKTSQDVEAFEKLQSEKKTSEEKIISLEESANGVLNNISAAEAKYEELIGKMEDAQKIRDLKQSKEQLFIALKELRDTLRNQQVLHQKKMYRNKWILKGCESFFHEYSGLFDLYIKKKLAQKQKEELEREKEANVDKIMKTRLPVNVPEPIYVQLMLDSEKCLICDRPAKKDSPEWFKIRELIELKSNNKQISQERRVVKNDFENEYRALYNVGLVLSQRIPEIDENIAESIKNIENIEGKIKNKSDEIHRIESDMDLLVGQTSFSISDADNIIEQIKTSNNQIRISNERLNSINSEITANKNNINRIDEQLAKLTTRDMPSWLKEKISVLNDFEEIATSTRERVFTDLVATLEEQANQHYSEMTVGNLSVKGRIKLTKLKNGNYMPEITDSQGNHLTGINTSNLILVKLSVIMAIISANYIDFGGNLEDGIDLYTLITDAPTSVFGDAYTIGFCKTVSKVYKQSIIMSKEFYRNENLKQELLNNADIKLGKVYLIAPSVKEDERIDRNNLFTSIERLN